MDDQERTIKMSENIVRLQEQVAGLQRMVTEFVSKAEFQPVKTLAYGLATAIMSAVIMAILAKVIIK